MPFPKTSPQVSFSALEEQTLAFWRDNDTFHTSIRQREEEGAPDYVFYDGPPFATGLPHYGHILTSYIKDTVPRYWTMRGYRVDRRWGWDCHGLPIENEIERELGVNGRQEIEKYGLDKFNERCSEVVTKYTKEWEDVITRLGRWVDFVRDYKTMDRDYMESVMGVFKGLWDKGLVYEGDKVVPYCYRCQTPLSNFEARLDDSFRPRQDPSLTISFKLLEPGPDGKPDHILAWTTTPWTLPSNMGLVVGEDITYVQLRDDAGTYWLAKERMAAFEKELAGTEVINEAPGSALVGRRYEPLFPYFAHLAEPNPGDGPDNHNGAFRVVAGDFVSTEDGTGIVHAAPAFGEEDYELGMKVGLPRPCPVDSQGRFSDEVTDFAGQNVHEANKLVAQALKDAGRVVAHQTIDHNYPHCWRDDTPLIYKTVPTWYVNVTKVKQDMLAANQQINWVPSHIRDGRFGDWLSNARDWAISRSRFWGAPIPVWICDKTGEQYVPASVAELEAKAGVEIPDLHRPMIDEITFPSPAGGTFRRVPEVLDCWFESGSMPYAQVHYPFENKEWFENNFPADFIVEYIAQTRGWFYTLVVLAAALFERPPFKNCLCHGVVLAEDGRKMSKRLKNYPDPMEVVGKYGSDSLRIALLSSPVVRGGNVNFKERDVEEAMRSFMIPFWNAWHFFATYANIDEWVAPEHSEDYVPKPHNHTDRFILAKLEQLKETLSSAMEAYDIVTCYEALVVFIDQLNNWYIRLSRRRFWSGEATESKKAAYAVLHRVLRELALVSAPFTPFQSEEIYRGLCGEGESVHLQKWPEARPQLRDAELVARTTTAQKIINLGRQVREEHNLRVRQPLGRLGVAGVEPSLLDEYREEIMLDLNVKEVEWIEHPADVVRPEYRPNKKVLGPKLGKDLKTVIGAMSKGEVETLDGGRLACAGVELEAGEFDVRYHTLDGHLGSTSDGKLIVLLDLDVTEDLRAEGIAREVVRAVQSRRKELELEYTDRVSLSIATDSAPITAAVEKHVEYIKGETLATDVVFVASLNDYAASLELAEGKVDLAIESSART